jgi:hypothetical protein
VFIMQTPTANTGHQLPARLNSLAAMASLFERLDRNRTTASAEQYRTLARRVTELLAVAEPDNHLQALLNVAPASAMLYENLRYEQAGLVRAPLEMALNAELAATAAIAKARLR